MKNLAALCLLLFSTFVFGLTAPKPIDRITVAVNPILPPYVFTGDGTGLQLEILKSAFKSQGITDLDIIYMTNKRTAQSLQDMTVDVAMNYGDAITSNIFPSKSLLSYNNVAISLKKNNYKINTIYDLSGKSVLSFQNATEFLPAPFKAVSAKLDSYGEMTNSEALVEHLLKERVNVVILDKRIFQYYLEQYKKSGSIQAYTMHPIFPEAPRPAYFNSKVLQEVFDMGLAHIIASGEYSAIMAFDGSDYAQVVD
ncbi:transporter substrate-binding domain-containing protein [Pseudoalteromonas shioyasakiensis]|uniref:substrate-binding periplasmic protein n=1 Tax=Pseudoalteromonas shioyasakiensis TaxID=1190813 RepID=UPI002118525E|nr:transporter substrate-binding domain-containing protein [Pseudoalteromonas shioyasakiensis]MCQ8878508.1 transporter substrate-binding domain-containing protein [Pseudoalteromonas shioyasakiensis]